MTIHLRGDAIGLSKLLDKLGKKFPSAAVKGMREVGMRLGGEMIQAEIQATQPIPVDMGQYKASWKRIRTAKGCLVVNTSKQAVAVEVGRKPGTMPPLEPLLAWAKRKGFPRWARAAVAIQRKIFLKGIKGRLVLLHTIQNNEPEMARTLEASIREQAGGLA